MYVFNKYHLFLSVIFLLNQSCVFPKKGKYFPYEMAFSQVTSKEMNLKISVNRELVCFKTFSHFFQEELTSNQSFRDDELMFELCENKVRSSISKIGIDKYSAKSILFFTEIEKGFFFAELFEDLASTNITYDTRPSFGESKVFLFHYKEKSKTLEVISSKVMHYN